MRIDARSRGLWFGLALIMIGFIMVMFGLSHGTVEEPVNRWELIP